MQVNHIRDLPSEAERAVIINVGTDLASTLALASAIKRCSMPTVLINCAPSPESRSHFNNLMAVWDFDMLEAPLMEHGSVLDRVFSGTKAASLLLLDSDAEIRDPSVIERMRQDLKHPRVFGAGFVHGAAWLGEPSGCAPNVALYEERPWIPLVMFRTEDIRRGLAAGATFEIRVIYNDLIFSKVLSKQLAKRLQTSFTPPSRIVDRLPERARLRLRASTFPALRWARRDVHGVRPNIVYLDTGADIYQWCKYHEGKRFSGVPFELVEGNQVVHYQGLTRAKLYGGHKVNFLRRPISDIEGEIRDRLVANYGLDASVIPGATVASTAGLLGES
jgi:hypothetical protein